MDNELLEILKEWRLVKAQKEGMIRLCDSRGQAFSHYPIVKKVADTIFCT